MVSLSKSLKRIVVYVSYYSEVLSEYAKKKKSGGSGKKWNLEWATLIVPLIVKHQAIVSVTKGLLKWGQHFPKMVNHFLSKSSKFHTVWPVQFLFKFHQHVIQILIK